MITKGTLEDISAQAYEAVKTLELHAQKVFFLIQSQSLAGESPAAMDLSLEIAHRLLHDTSHLEHMSRHIACENIGVPAMSEINQRAKVPFYEAA